MGNINMNSPLVYDRAMSGALRAYARANQCPVIVPFVLSGATAPVTMAAAVAQSYAEVLVGCALGQLERPGSLGIALCLRKFHYLGRFAVRFANVWHA